MKDIRQPNVGDSFAATCTITKHATFASYTKRFVKLGSGNKNALLVHGKMAVKLDYTNK